MLAESPSHPAEKPCLVSQFKNGRLAAKDISFPDRFSDAKLLQLLEQPNEEGEEQKVENGGRDFVGSFFSQKHQCSRVMQAKEQHSEVESYDKVLITTGMQPENCGGNGSLPSEGHFIAPVASEGKSKRSFLEDLYLRRLQEDSNNSLKKRIRKREELQERSGQPLLSHGKQRSLEGKPWISHLDTGVVTQVRLEREKMRDVPHAMWAKNHERYLQFYTGHRNACLENLEKRRMDNREMELYCRFPHCR